MFNYEIVQLSKGNRWVTIEKRQREAVVFFDISIPLLTGSRINGPTWLVFHVCWTIVCYMGKKDKRLKIERGSNGR